MKISVCLAVALLACGTGCNGDDAPASCDGCACEDYCVELCEYAAAECGGILKKDCTLGCFEFEPTMCETAPIEGRGCEYIQIETSCYEALASYNGDCFASYRRPPGVCHPGTGTDCNADDLCNPETSLCEPCNEDSCDGHCSYGACVECLETTDCGSTQECLDNVCRERCSDSVPCVSGQQCTYQDLCSDPIGKPCDSDALDFETCFGGECVDENASLETVAPYCTNLCIGTDCPSGYVCDGTRCLQE